MHKINGKFSTPIEKNKSSKEQTLNIEVLELKLTFLHNYVVN